MYASQGTSSPSRDMLGLESPFAETLDENNEMVGTTAFAEAYLDEAEGEELEPAPRSFLGGPIWSFRSQACAAPVALFVPPAARGRDKVGVLVVVHGLLHVCARPRKVPEGLISDVPLNVGKAVVDSGLPLVVVAPLLQSGQGWSVHNLNRPATLNALLAEVLAEVGRNQSRPSVEIDRLVIAGHSKAYEVLYPLARNHRSPQLATGALARLSNVWVLDATYGAPPNSDFAALAAAKPGLRVDIVYRASTRNKSSPTDKYRGRSQDGPVSLLPISAEGVGHCSVPARILPKLLADLPAVPSGESFDSLEASAWEEPSGEGLDWLDPQAGPLGFEPEAYPLEAESEANAVREAGVRAAIQQVRTAGAPDDRAAIRQTLEARGSSIESWFGDHVADATFCGVRIVASGGRVAGVHRTLLDALKRAENALLARNPGLGATELARKLGIKRIVGLRPPKKATGGTLPSRHCFGLAIDINPSTNPFVGNRKLKKGADRRFLENRSPAIIERAMKLLRGEKFNIERTPVPGSAGEAWDVHDRASRTLAEYLRLADQVNGDRVGQLAEAARRAGDPRSLEEWKRWIVTDRQVIRNWDFENHPAPERGGYMDLPRELVVALGDAGLVWGGLFYGAKDIMHFHLPTLDRQAQPRREAFDAAETEYSSRDEEPDDFSTDEGESEALAWLDMEEPAQPEAFEPEWTESENLEPRGLDVEESFDTFEQEEGPSHAFKDCSIAQRKLLIASADRARRALVWAEKYVADAHGRPHKMSQTVRRLLLEHFHTTGRRNLRDILTNLLKLRHQFEKGIRFECEASCPPIGGRTLQGYANRSQWFGGFGNVHMCFGGGFNFADPTISDRDRDILVIHEVAHRYLGIDDKAYFFPADPVEGPKYAGLSAKQAMDNADSYAAFAVEMNAARPKFIRESEAEEAWLGEEMSAYEEGLDSFDEEPEAEELALLEERRLDPSVMDIAERVMAGEESFFEGEAPKRWTSCFSSADVGRVEKAYQDNITAADANSNDRCNCIVMLNVGIGQLLSLPTKSHPARDPEKTSRRVQMAKLPTETIEKAMAKLRSLGNAGPRRDVWFLDRRGRRATSLKPERLQSSVETIVKAAATTKGCWYGFGLSLLDGYHSVMLLVDRTGDTPRIYWLDQFKNGLTDEVTGTLDDRITERTQTFWQSVWDDKKKAYNGIIRLWPLRKRAP